MAGNELATDKRIASEHATLRADFSLATDLLRQVSVSSDNPTRDFGRPLDSVYWCEVRCDEESRLSERDYLFGESDGEELWDPTRLEDILGTLVDEFYGR